MTRHSPAVSLLTRRFLQALQYNDLLSPSGGEGRDGLATAGAGVITLGLFASFLLSFKYLMTPFLSPGVTAVAMLDDTFLFVGWSMIVGGLVAVAQWNAIALDARDVAILGPLPVRPAEIVRAKLTALVLFAAGLATALNAVPSLVYPVLVTTGLQAGAAETAGSVLALRLVIGHAISTMAAALFGFASILAVREIARAATGSRVFDRMAPAIQSALLVILVVAFLLLPGGSARVARTWLAPDRTVRNAVPVVWFVGLHETIVGNSVVALPVSALPWWPARKEAQDLPLYRSRAGTLHALGGIAAGALALVAGLALGAYLWNSRRVTLPHVQRARGRTARLMTRALEHSVARRPAVRAGFFLALKTLARSTPHRAALAIGAAAGLAATVLNVDVRSGMDLSQVPKAFLASQFALVTALVIAFRHAMRVPADPRASWVFQLAWSGAERQYRAGVKRAAIVALIVPASVALLPLQVVVLGRDLALWHGLFGILAGWGLLEVLMSGGVGLPLAAGFVPSDNLKWVGPIGFVVFLGVSYGLTSIERVALASPGYSLALAVALAVAAAAAWLAGRRRPLSGSLVGFDDTPASATQTLRLSD